MADSEWVIYALIATGAIAAALVVLYATRTVKAKGKKRVPEVEVAPIEAWRRRYAVAPGRTVTADDAQKAKEHLKILDLEREILSFAIRRCYEAQAEGKITEEERERIAQLYKSRMLEVRDNLSKNESVVALHQLESMQEDLIKLFSERFDDLGKKVEELRTRLDFESEEEKVPSPEIAALPSAEEAETEAPEKERRKVRKKPAAPPQPKTDAEKRIDEIRAEVEKVLERLGQIEVEGET